MVISTRQVSSKQLDELRCLIHQKYQSIETLLNRLSRTESEYNQQNHHTIRYAHL